MTRKYKIALSLNFDNKQRYHFTVRIPKKIDEEGIRELVAVNAAGKEFKLSFLGPALMEVLVQLDHANQFGLDDEIQTWEMHDASKKSWHRELAERCETLVLE